MTSSYFFHFFIPEQWQRKKIVTARRDEKKISHFIYLCLEIFGLAGAKNLSSKIAW